MRKATDVAFHVGLFVKGVDALFEVAGGVLLTMPTKLARYITLLAEHEAFRHHLALAGKLDNLASTVLMKPETMQAVYLIVHGLAKVVLISAIFANRKWGYSGLFWVLSIFSLIEIVRAVLFQEYITGALAAFDIILVVLIYKEFRERFGASQKLAARGVKLETES